MVHTKHLDSGETMFVGIQVNLYAGVNLARKSAIGSGPETEKVERVM